MAKEAAWRLCHLAGDELVYLAGHTDAFSAAVEEANLHARIERFGRVARESSPGEMGVPVARLGEAIPQEEGPTEEELYPPETWGDRAMFMDVRGVWLQGVDGIDYFVSWEPENPGAFFWRGESEGWMFVETWDEYGEIPTGGRGGR